MRAAEYSEVEWRARGDPMYRLPTATLLIVIVGTTVVTACSAERGGKAPQLSESMQQGIVDFKNGDYRKAVSTLEPYASAGEKPACSFVGLAYALGLGVPVDTQKAKGTFDYCPADAPSNYFLVAKELEKRDAITSIEWYIDAAELGSPSASTRIADAYANGELGLAVDLEQSDHWRERSKQLR